MRARGREGPVGRNQKLIPQTTTTPIIPIIQNHAHHGSPSPPKAPNNSGRGAGGEGAGRSGARSTPHPPPHPTRFPKQQPTQNPKNPNSETKLAVNLPSQRQVCSKFPFHPKPQILRKPPSHNPHTTISIPYLTLHPESHHKTPQTRTCRSSRPPSGNFRQIAAKTATSPTPKTDRKTDRLSPIRNLRHPRRPRSHNQILRPIVSSHTHDEVPARVMLTMQHHPFLLPRRKFI